MCGRTTGSPARAKAVDTCTRAASLEQSRIPRSVQRAVRGFAVHTPAKLCGAVLIASDRDEPWARVLLACHAGTARGYIAPWHCCLLYAARAVSQAGRLACDAVRHRIDERLVHVEHERQRALARREPASRDGHEPRKGANGQRKAEHLRRDRCGRQR